MKLFSVKNIAFFKSKGDAVQFCHTHSLPIKLIKIVDVFFDKI